MTRVAADFARIYGSAARVAWIRAQPCMACGRGPCENAHTISGGMGRKADYETIIPLCWTCHNHMHLAGWAVLGARFANRDLLKTLAHDTQRRWLLHLACRA